MDQLLTRQVYQDRSAGEARERGYDICQLKYDGWWDRIEILDGLVQHYSRTGRLFKEHTIADKELSCTLIGEHMMGTQWSQAPLRLGKTFLFDCWKWQGSDLRPTNYRDRYRVAWMAPQRLSEMFQMVTSYRMERQAELWSGQVEAGAYEGLVYRRSTDDTNGIVFREKLIITEDLQCTGFVEGMGKFAGTLGALQAKNKDGVQIDVGGGFSDEERQKIWDNPSVYLDRWFEVEARARFESGSLRHPNFVKWRDTK